MELRQAVYALEPVLDNPRFEGFGTLPGKRFPKSIPLNRTTRDWKVIRLAKTWAPMEVIGRVRKFNDYPCVGLSHPAFSARAIEALRDMLEPNGEILPLSSTLGSYFHFNVTTIADVLDIKRSEIRWNREPIIASTIERYVFDPSSVRELSIFRIPEEPLDIYVTETFVARVVQCGLRGMNFKKVWPLPSDVIWWQLAKTQKKLTQSEGLPNGRWVKGNTVVLRLGLKDGEATKKEQAAIQKIMNELDALLVDVNSDAPAVGNLEGHDYTTPGECRLFISCPDADKLVEWLRAWLKGLSWPNWIVVLKRYGEYVDKDAREEEAII